MLSKSNHQDLFFIFSFFLLGFTALIFQVVFAKYLVLVFGLTAPAIATVLAVYFLGLALGSFVFGRLADQVSPPRPSPPSPPCPLPLTLYPLLFFATALYGLLFPYIFKLLNLLILAVNKIYPLDFSGFNLVAVLFSFVFLLLPSFCIGGGLPILSKIFITKGKAVGNKVSLLYFVETFGSVLGAAAAGFWLLPSFGNNIALLFASLLNLGVGAALIFAFAKSTSPKAILREFLRFNLKAVFASVFSFARKLGSPPYNPTSKIYRLRPITQPFFLYVLFFTGFLALALELVYTKTLILILGNSTYAFSLILITFLSGIALGSLFAFFCIAKAKRGLTWLGILLGATGAWLFVTLKLFGELPFWYIKIFRVLESFDFSSVLLAQSLIAFLVIFPATFFMGITFPLAIRLAEPGLKNIGEGIGRLYVANTVGGVFGSMATGFFLLAAVGYQKTLVLIVLCYLFFAGFCVLKERGMGSRMGKFAKGGIVFVLLLLGAASVFSSPWRKEVLSLGSFPYMQKYVNIPRNAILEQASAQETILFYKEGLSQVVVIEEKGGSRFLKINGKTDASTRGDLESEILIGSLPMLFHENPKDVLVVGLGAGVSLGSITQFEEAERIDLAEIDPSVIEAVEYFTETNHNAIHDPRVNIILGDARAHLRLTDKTYDVISSEPSNPWVSGNAYLFTKEYYELAKSRLKDDGLMLQWLHVYNLDTHDLRVILRTFHEAFPSVFLFEPLVTGGDLFVVGSPQENYALNFDDLAKKFNAAKVREELARIFITSPQELISYLAATDRELEGWWGDVKIHTDNHPILEYSAPKTIYKNTVGTNKREIALLREKMTETICFSGATSSKRGPTPFSGGADEGAENSQLAPCAVVGGNPEELQRYFAFRELLNPFHFAIQGNNFAEAERLCREMVKLGIPISHPGIKPLLIERCYE